MVSMHIDFYSCVFVVYIRFIYLVELHVTNEMIINVFIGKCKYMIEVE